MRLLNYTKKSNIDVKNFFKQPDMLRFPFDRLVSRLKYKTDQFHFSLQSETIEELLRLKPRNMSFADCCHQRALELLALNKDFYYIAYSGGIDSTTAIVSLLSTWPVEALKKVRIFLTQHSITENPHFFSNYISQFKLLSFLDNPSQFLVGQNSIMIMGELGDQLFGADFLGITSQKFGDEALHKDFREYVPKTLGSYFLDDELGKKVFANIEPIVEESPFPIRTTHDFFWWLNFTQKWQHVKYRFVALASWDLHAKYGTHILNFYDTPYFQQWSLNNHDKKIGPTWDSYKYVAKDFIYSFTKDRTCLGLTKVQSLKNVYIMNTRRIAVTEDYQAITSTEDLKNYVVKPS